jgi:hypothetical protein
VVGLNLGRKTEHHCCCFPQFLQGRSSRIPETSFSVLIHHECHHCLDTDSVVKQTPERTWSHGFLCVRSNKSLAFRQRCVCADVVRNLCLCMPATRKPVSGRACRVLTWPVGLKNRGKYISSWKCFCPSCVRTGDWGSKQRGWLDGCGVIITVKEKGEKYHPVRVVGSHTEIQHKDGHDQGKKVQSFQFAPFFVRSSKLPNLLKSGR